MTEHVPVAGSNGPSFFFKRRKTETLPAVAASLSTTNLASINDAVASRPTTAIKSPDEQQQHRHHRRDSSLSSLSELGSTFRKRRSASLRSSRGGAGAGGARSPTFWDNVTSTSDTLKRSTSTMRPQPPPVIAALPSSDSLASLERTSTRPPTAATDSKPRSGLRREDSVFRPATALDSSSASGRTATTSSHAGSHDGRASARRIRDAASRRISLLKYLRMIYASETHWFNTYRFTPAQIRSLPSMHPPRLARRTQSLLLLGISIPFVLDPNHESLVDYLRAFSSLLSEYDSYITLHPWDGGSSSALSRARIPQLFKRGPAKGRRGSSGEALLSSPQSSYDTRSAGFGTISGSLPSSATWSTFPSVSQEQDLHPGEEYQFLLTPSLPFDADYFATFSTLCEVFSDCYRHIVSLVDKQEAEASASDAGGGLQMINELFTKVDAKVKKVVLSGLVKEFEDASKQGIRSELAGVGKLVLGGLV